MNKDNSLINNTNSILEYSNKVKQEKITLSKLLIDAVNTFRLNFKQWFKDVPNNINETINEMIGEILNYKSYWVETSLSQLQKQLSKYSIESDLNTNDLLSIHYLENQLKLISALNNQLIELK